MPRTMSDENDVRNLIAERAEADGWHVSHIESGVTSPGIPDLALTKNNVTLWLEIKYEHNGEINLRATQRKWHREQHKAKGVSWVLAWINGRIHPTPGNTAAELTPKAIRWSCGDSWDRGEVVPMLRHLARVQAALTNQ